MTLIIDASVALKWVFDEEGSDAALRLLETETLAAPDLLWAECANVIWTRTRKELVSMDDGRAAVAALRDTPVDAIELRGNSDAAHAIATDLDQTVYDSLYLAVAIARHAKFVTADMAFLRAAARHAVYKDFVVAL